MGAVGATIGSNVVSPFFPAAIVSLPEVRLMRASLRAFHYLLALLASFGIALAYARQPFASDSLEAVFQNDVRPLVEKYCVECHGNEQAEAKLNLSGDKDLAQVNQ